MPSYLTVSIDPPAYQGSTLVGTLKCATMHAGKVRKAAELREDICKYCTLEFGMGRLEGDMQTGSLVWRLDPLL